MGRGRNTSNIVNNNGGDPPGGGGGGGPQIRQKLRVGESAGSAAASASGGAMLANIPSPAPRPASGGGSVLSRLANMDAGRAVRALATGGLSEAPAAVKTVLDHAKKK